MRGEVWTSQGSFGPAVRWEEEISMSPAPAHGFKWAHEDDSQGPARKGELSAAWEKVMLKIQIGDSTPKANGGRL